MGDNRYRLVSESISFQKVNIYRKEMTIYLVRQIVLDVCFFKLYKAMKNHIPFFAILLSIFIYPPIMCISFIIIFMLLIISAVINARAGKQRLREAKIQVVDYFILLLAGACLGSLAKVSDQNFGAVGYTYSIIAVCKLKDLRFFMELSLFLLH